MITQDPYQYKSVAWSRQPGVDAAVARYIISDYTYLQSKELVQLNKISGEHGSLNPVVLYGLTKAEEDIPPLSQTYFTKDSKAFVVDVRQSVSVDKVAEKASVRNEAQFELAVQKAILAAQWYVGGVDELYSYKFPHEVYGEWLASSIARKFGLDMGAQVRLQALGLLYYATLFHDAPLTEEQADQVGMRCRSSMAPELVKEVWTQTKEMQSFDDFTANCFVVTNNVRLKHLDYTVMVSVLGNSWFGQDAQENVLLSLAHPPTWISLVHAALTQKAHRNSALAKSVEGKNKRGAGEDFLKALVYATRSHKRSDT